MLVNIPVKFHCDILNGFRVTERTQFVTDRRTDDQGKNNMSPTPLRGDIKTQIMKRLLSGTCIQSTGFIHLTVSEKKIFKCFFFFFF